MTISVSPVFLNNYFSPSVSWVNILVFCSPIPKIKQWTIFTYLGGVIIFFWNVLSRNKLANISERIQVWMGLFDWNTKKTTPYPSKRKIHQLLKYSKFVELIISLDTIGDQLTDPCTNSMSMADAHILWVSLMISLIEQKSRGIPVRFVALP